MTLFNILTLLKIFFELIASFLLYITMYFAVIIIILLLLKFILYLLKKIYNHRYNILFYLIQLNLIIDMIRRFILREYIPIRKVYRIALPMSYVDILYRYFFIFGTLSSPVIFNIISILMNYNYDPK